MRTETDFLGNQMNFDCMGCAIVEGEISVPGDIIYQGNAAIIAADPEVPIPGFLVVNTKRHIKSLSDLNNTERHELADIVATAEKALKSFGINEVTLVQEERSSHFHIWIFPNYAWMADRFGKGVSYLRDISAYAKEHADDETRQKVLSTISEVRNFFEGHNIAE